MVRDLTRLVDADKGVLSWRMFIERDVTRRSWRTSSPAAGCSIANESQVPSPVDFITTYMGKDPVLV